MSLVATVQAIAREQMADIANKICDDYKSSVQGNLKRPGESTGEASGSIAVTQTGETSYRIGASNLHLYFFEEGNGSRIIYPKNAKALQFKDGSFHNRANPYAGKHINAEVAKRWNG